MNKKLLLLIIIAIISSCSTKQHIITEWDGNKEIKWHSTKKKIMNRNEQELNKDIKRVATALEKLIKLLTKLIKDNA